MWLFWPICLYQPCVIIIFQLTDTSPVWLLRPTDWYQSCVVILTYTRIQALCDYFDQLNYTSPMWLFDQEIDASSVWLHTYTSHVWLFRATHWYQPCVIISNNSMIPALCDYLTKKLISALCDYLTYTLIPALCVFWPTYWYQPCVIVLTYRFIPALCNHFDQLTDTSPVWLFWQTHWY